MALEEWQPSGWPSLREGQALFDIKPARGQFSTYHAMLVGPQNAESASPEHGIQVAVVQMGPPLSFGNNPTAKHQVAGGTFLGFFRAFSGENYNRVADAMRELERRAGTPGVEEHYSLGTHGVEVPDPNNPNETLPGIRCSCASLVEWCYEQAGTDLVMEADLPKYTLDDVHAQFCPRRKGTTQPRLTKEEVSLKLIEWDLLPENSPWPLLLPAQQMWAFRKGFRTLPHRAAIADHPFIPMPTPLATA